MKLTFKKPGGPKKIGGKKLKKPVFSSKYIYIVVYLAGVAALAYVGNFIYKNYYQTITQAEEIADLKKEVAPDSIDITKVNKVLEDIDKKSTSTAAFIPPETKNPFDASPIASQPAPVTPTATPAVP